MKTCKISGREYPVAGYVKDDIFGTVPAVDVPVMSDYKWHLSCLNSRLENPEMYRTVLGEDVEATIAQLRECLKGAAAL